MNQPFDREFLLRLAPVWLACRWRIMTNRTAGEFWHHRLTGHWPRPSLENDLLGMLDYGHEMKLLCKAEKERC